MQNPAEDIAQLLAQLDQDPSQRVQIKASLLELGDLIVEPLIAAVRSGEGRKAWVAAEVLGQLVNPHAFQTLVVAIRSPNLLIGCTAVAAVSNYRDRDVLPVLLESFPQVPLMTQQCIILSFQQLGDARAVPALIDQLKLTESSVLRVAIIQTLGKLADTRAIPAIEAFVLDKDYHVREWVAVALRQLSGDQV